MSSKALKKTGYGQSLCSTGRCTGRKTPRHCPVSNRNRSDPSRSRSSTAIAIEYLAMLPEPTLGPPPPDKLRTAWLRFAREEELRRVSVIEARLWRKRQTEIELLAELKTIRQRCCRRKERKDKKQLSD